MCRHENTPVHKHSLNQNADNLDPRVVMTISARQQVIDVMLRPRAGWAVALALVVPLSVSAAADDAPASPAGAADGTTRAGEFLALAMREAGRYTLHRSSGEESLELVEEPVLKWSNPVIGEIYGGVFLWTSDGRPEAVGSIFKWYSPHTHMTHEFQSLSPGNVTATLDKRTVWTTSRPGVEFQRIPDAPAPVETRGGRLLQMRRLARQFSAVLTRDEVSHDLRLQPHPLYRYGDGGNGWSDGALFAFVLGTDPDVLLMIEAKPTEDGEDAWYFAPARMHWRPLRVLHNEQEVWHVSQLSPGDYYSGTEPYLQIEFRDKQE